MRILTKWTIAVSASMLVAGSALSGPSWSLISHDFVKQDGDSGNPTSCPGVFGDGGFGTCNISIDGHDLSPVIAKYDANGDFVEKNEIYSSFSGSEIEINFGDKGEGSWNYDRGVNDPGIKYWAAFGGAGFTLSWYVDPVHDEVCPEGSAFNLSCLQKAEVVTDGLWSVPENQGGNRADLSNLVFFNSGNDVPVPEPGTAALLFSGLMGLFMARRRQRSLQA